MCYRQKAIEPKLFQILMLYKNLSRNDKKLYKLTYERGLTEWHFTAARILERVNGMKNAMGYLEKCDNTPKQKLLF